MQRKLTRVHVCFDLWVYDGSRQVLQITSCTVMSRRCLKVTIGCTGLLFCVWQTVKDQYDVTPFAQRVIVSFFFLILNSIYVCRNTTFALLQLKIFQNNPSCPRFEFHLNDSTYISWPSSWAGVDVGQRLWWTDVTIIGNDSMMQTFKQRAQRHRQKQWDRDRNCCIPVLNPVIILIVLYTNN